MKFRIYGLIMVVLIISSGTCLAQDSGLTNGKNVFKLDAGYQYQEFDMDLTKSTSTTIQWNDDYEVPYERDLFLVEASYGIFSKLDILLGVGLLKDKLVADRRDNTIYDHVQKGSDNISWKVGLKANFLTFGPGAYIGSKATYSQWNSGDDSYVASGTNDPRDIKTEWSELAVSLYAGIKLGNFSPYAGIEYTDIDVTQKLSDYPLTPSRSNENEYEIENKWGAVAGLTYSFTDHFDLIVKTRLINQNSFNISMSYKF